MTEKQARKQKQEFLMQYYRDQGCPKLAEYYQKYGSDFGLYFEGPCEDTEAFAAKCLKEGHPMSWYDRDLPEGVVL